MVRYIQRFLCSRALEMSLLATAVALTRAAATFTITAAGSVLAKAELSATVAIYA